jgi:hypothetical protein
MPTLLADVASSLLAGVLTLAVVGVCESVPERRQSVPDTKAKRVCFAAALTRPPAPFFPFSVWAAVYLLLLRPRPPRRLSQAAVTAEIDRLKVRVWGGGRGGETSFFLFWLAHAPPFPFPQRLARPPSARKQE